MKTILESTLPAPKHIADVERRSEKDDALFAELTEVLKKHNAIDRFGVSLLHRHFDIAPGECLLETTQVETRTQTIEPITTEALRSEKYIETSWRLGDGFVATNCVCRDYGNGHSHYPRHSDQRLKSDVQPLDDALDQILRLHPVSYDYRQDVTSRSLPQGKQLGLIAQQTERVIPECVSTGKDGYKQIDYVSLVPVLIAAVQEQQRQIGELQTEVSALHREARSTELSCV